MRSPRHSGRAVTHHETNFLERSSRELSHAQFPVHQGNGKSGSLDSHPSGSPVGRTYSNANGSLLPSEKVVEFGDQASESPLPENIREPNHGSFLPQNSSLSLSPGGAQRPKSMLSMNDDRYGNFIIREYIYIYIYSLSLQQLMNLCIYSLSLQQLTNLGFLLSLFCS